MRKLTSVLLGAILVCAPFTACRGDNASDNSVAPPKPTADWLESQLAEQDNLLWVYRDNGDVLNYFTQKSFMGDNYNNVPEMDEKAAGHSSTSGIMAELDIAQHLWGGYMFLNGTLEAGSTIPAANDGNAPVGMDLTGAKKLTFYAKGDTGEEHVEFFMGGFGWTGNTKTGENPDTSKKITLGTVSLSKEWEKFELPLKDANLSSIACGFGWVTNDTSNRGLTKVRFYMDDIRYEFTDG